MCMDIDGYLPHYCRLGMATRENPQILGRFAYAIAGTGGLCALHHALLPAPDDQYKPPDTTAEPRFPLLYTIHP